MQFHGVNPIGQIYHLGHICPGGRNVGQRTCAVADPGAIREHPDAIGEIALKYPAGVRPNRLRPHFQFIQLTHNRPSATHLATEGKSARKVARQRIIDISIAHSKNWVRGSHDNGRVTGRGKKYSVCVNCHIGRTISQDDLIPQIRLKIDRRAIDAPDGK